MSNLCLDAIEYKEMSNLCLVCRGCAIDLARLGLERIRERKNDWYMGRDSAIIPADRRYVCGGDKDWEAPSGPCIDCHEKVLELSWTLPLTGADPEPV